MAETVWILGAGFSRGLSGPLLNNLLAPGTRERLLAVYPDVAAVHESEAARDTYAIFEEGKGRHWQNAEEFLVETDRAADGEASVVSGLLSKQSGTDAASLRTTVRRIIAAQCCEFLKDATHEKVLGSEAWKPYLNWARQLDGRDAIITFNYDRALECMIGGPIVQMYGKGLTVIVEESKRELARAAGTVAVFKLHGSVSWRRIDDRRGWGFAETNNPNFALSCAPELMAFGTPGNAKQSTVRDFRGLWNMAMKELAEAKRVYVIGYSFPDSDSHPAMEFLETLRRNPLYRVLKIVVGQDAPTQERIRYHFKSLAQIEVEPAKTERFFQSWERDDSE